ncbi:MAG TPA: arginase family protein [Longimicrobiales bacterium]|nr:arginase family protein [Longimicrobiales bacterium]
MTRRGGIDVVLVPWDSGRRGWRMGAGPLRLAERGLFERLRDLGHDVRRIDIELPSDASSDAHSAYLLAADIAAAVRRATNERRFPLVIAGNCNSALGTIAGLDAAATGVVWFDAHGDYNTPETSVSGFLDGMSLATLTGCCCVGEAARIPGFAPVAEDTVALIGARDLDDGERKLLDGSGVRLIAPGAAINEQLAAAVESWPAGVDQAYVHVDLDVLDPDEARVNEYAAAGGLTVPDLFICVDAVASHSPLAAAAVTALDPDADADGRALAAAIAVIEQIVTRADLETPARS